MNVFLRIGGDSRSKSTTHLSLETPLRLRPPILLILLLSLTWFGSPHIAHAEDDFAKRYQAYQGDVKSGEAFLKKGDYTSAIKSLTKAIETSPFETANYFYRGIALYKSGKEVEALGDFDRVITLKPKMSAAFVYRGLCFEKMEKYEEAINNYTSALKITPKDASIHNNLAWLYATAKDETFQDKIKALEHAVKAATLSGEKNAEILDTLARVYFINGKITDAVVSEKKALKLEPNNEVFKANLMNYQQRAEAKMAGDSETSAIESNKKKEERKDD